ncbi:MAG: substrate-binding periplasmic protein [Aeromonadaceae bacterium]
MLRITLLLLLFTANAMATEPFPTLHYYTEQAPPFNYRNAKGDIDGFSVQLLKLVMQELGAPPPTIQLLPWDQAYYLLTQKPTAVLFSVSRTPNRDKQFKWACSISRSRIILLAKSGKQGAMVELSQVGSKRVGAIKADVGEQLLLNHGFNEQQTVTTQSLHQVIHMLVAGRIPYAAVHEINARYELEKLGLEQQSYTPSLILATLDDCYAFNRAISDEVVQRFEQALRQLKQRPEFGQLQAEYQLRSVAD